MIVTPNFGVNSLSATLGDSQITSTLKSTLGCVVLETLNSVLSASEYSDHVIIAPSCSRTCNFSSEIIKLGIEKVKRYLTDIRKNSTTIIVYFDNRVIASAFPWLVDYADKIINEKFGFDHNQIHIFDNTIYHPYKDMNESHHTVNSKIVVVADAALHNDFNLKYLGMLNGEKFKCVSINYKQQKHRIPDHLMNWNIYGHLNNSQFAKELSTAKACVILSSPTTEIALNALILKSTAMCVPTIIVGEVSDENLEFKTSAYYVTDLRQAVSLISMLEIDKHAAQKKTHIHWRSNAINNGMNKFIKSAEIGEPYPLVSCITPSLYPNRCDKVAKNYNEQTYKNKEQIIVANGSEDFGSCFTDSITGKYIHIQGKCGASFALNVGVLSSEGEFCARFDDDDNYHPNYILDNVLHSIFSGADLVGKAMRVIKFEDERQLLLRSFPKHMSMHVGHPSTKSDRIAGNSFFWRRKLHSLPFDSSAYGHADSDFLSRIRNNKNLTVAYGDIFNLEINRRDKNHTWDVGKEFFLKNGEWCDESFEC